ncbi:hypothetical protein FQR65_LT18326 [Abscondita terminalis]|nr:hypothetical protein FQR65_LT18326 [Abscondita terminalis]
MPRDNADRPLLEHVNDDTVTIKCIMNKIKNLRSTYHHQLKKFKDSKHSGAGGSEVYEPHLTWFMEMHPFLSDSLDYRDTISTQAKIQEFTSTKTRAYVERPSATFTYTSSGSHYSIHSPHIYTTPHSVSLNKPNSAMHSPEMAYNDNDADATYLHTALYTSAQILQDVWNNSSP